MRTPITSVVLAGWLAVCLPATVSAQTGSPVEKPRAPASGPGKRLDSIAVVVNGEAITWAEIRKKLLDVAANLEYRTEAERQKKLLKEAIRQLRSEIESKLLVQMARAAGDIRVTSEELDKAVAEQQRAAGSLIDYMRSLQTKGQTVSQAREDERERLLRQKFFQANFFSTPWGQRYRRYSVRVSPGEIRTYYRKNSKAYRQKAAVWLRRVTIAAPVSGGLEAAKKLADRVRDALLKRDPPAKVNETFKLNAADLVKPLDALTEYGRGSGLPPKVEKWAFDAETEAGAVSDVIEYGRGLFAVFQLAKKRVASTRGFEDVQDEIEQQLYTAKFQRQMSLLVARLFQEADIRPPKLGAWLIRGRGAPPISADILQMLVDK